MHEIRCNITLFSLQCLLDTVRPSAVSTHECWTHARPMLMSKKQGSGWCHNQHTPMLYTGEKSTLVDQNTSRRQQKKTTITNANDTPLSSSKLFPPPFDHHLARLSSWCPSCFRGCCCIPPLFLLQQLPVCCLAHGLLGPHTSHVLQCGQCFQTTCCSQGLQVGVQEGEAHLVQVGVCRIELPALGVGGGGGYTGCTAVLLVLVLVSTTQLSLSSNTQPSLSANNRPYQQ